MGQISLTIDGIPVQVEEGTTLRAAAQAVGQEVPTVCWHENLTPANACRACVVEVEGNRALVASCSRVAEEGMVVHTQSPRVQNARRVVGELLASATDVSLAPSVQTLLERTQATPERLAGETREIPVRDDNRLYVRDYAKCILCYRCVEACGTDAQNTFAIQVAGRGFEAHIDAGFGRDMPESDCVFCGNCVAVCPTGALIDRSEWTLRQEGAWNADDIEVTQTVCSYCGVGCQLELHVQNNRIVKVTSPMDHPVTHGMLCVKGRYGYQYVQAEP
ncbi:formate dehydrogenase alpha subunit [Sulfobacillus acidophilus TPY]|uniref:Ferredoxin n=1 Tax=Sulfobacillus acidophilus (strain ATCC 700253 / DSM 10332 / NAL) TaxID=679936 RepID=G8TT93_SULAD|nr:formate dehydrogenase alpha subunit [Sulfobacillus acidophilus TPY]AEW04473.1 NAD-dependent formate dehydrogenase iron-sulfur protein [Sulfobacillus acidophilus DSM 10332]